MKRIAVFIILMTVTLSLNAQTYRVFKMEEYIKRGDYGYLQLIKELEFNGKENTISIEDDGFRTKGTIFNKSMYYIEDFKVLDDTNAIRSILFEYKDNEKKRQGDWVTFYALDYYEVVTLQGEITIYEQTVETVTKYYVKELEQ